MAESAAALLQSASQGRVGIDQRLIRAILDHGPGAVADIAAFSASDHSQDRLNLDPLLADLVHHFALSDGALSGGASTPGPAPEGLQVLLDIIRRNPDEIDGEQVASLLPYREVALDPLLSLYEEIGEERGSDVAFLLAGLRVRDPRVLALLEERIEFDAADGAFLLGLYGDPAARPALERMLAEIPEADAELRREFTYALELIAAPQPEYVPEPFDILAHYPETEQPDFSVLTEAERRDMLSSEDPLTRSGAAYSFFNSELDARVSGKLLELATTDPETKVRARAWESLGDATEDAAIRDAMLAALNDKSKPVEERGGAAVGLYAKADGDAVRRAIESLYEEGGHARVKALEAMWRSLWEPYAKHFPEHLDSTDPDLLHEVLRGVGYFQLTRYADKIASFFDREEPGSDLPGSDLRAELREDALFAYALAMPGETTRGRIRGMLRRIDDLAGLSAAEAELVMFGLDERLRLNGLRPVFAEEAELEVAPSSAVSSPASSPASSPPPASSKVGRNDPCPCGSGKKFKKCHGA